jgi:hypothetical protein
VTVALSDGSVTTVLITEVWKLPLTLGVTTALSATDVCQGDENAALNDSLDHFPTNTLLQPPVHSPLSLSLSSRDVLEKILTEDPGKRNA